MSTEHLPIWLLAEITYRCPLQCAYCSNPVEFARYKDELDTGEWVRVFQQARELGAVQLGLSGGEPLVRKDLETLVEAARGLGFYTNLLTSGVGLNEERLGRLREVGLDHIQISFQADSAELSDAVAGRALFEHKHAMAKAIHKHGYPMVFNVVLHRGNIDRLEQILQLADSVGADYVELANTQYHGWAYVNRDALMPTTEQLQRADALAETWKTRMAGRMRIYWVWSDYHERRPKPCMNGWGTTFLGVAPDGRALPCHGAASLPGLDLPSVRNASLQSIWQDSKAFNFFRGEDWMEEPCRSCPQRHEDFGGCRCQAYMLTGNAAATDPVCSLSPHHTKVLAAVESANTKGSEWQPLLFRNPANSKRLKGHARKT